MFVKYMPVDEKKRLMMMMSLHQANRYISVINKLPAFTHYFCFDFKEFFLWFDITSKYSTSTEENTIFLNFLTFLIYLSPKVCEFQSTIFICIFISLVSFGSKAYQKAMLITTGNQYVKERTRLPIKFEGNSN